MRTTPFTYKSKIFQEFKELDGAAYRSIVRFYEEYEVQIQQLEFEEYFELLVAYTSSLFELGAYYNHLRVVDLVIETSIAHNIKYYKGEDIYCKMLFKKAASYYNILEYGKAEYILRQLIKLDSHNEMVFLFLKKCKRRQRPQYVKNTRAVSIALFLLAAVVICLEILLIRPFYKMHIPTIELTRNLIFALGWIVLICGDLLHRWRINKRVNELAEAVREK